jgi:hypothetical protein
VGDAKELGIQISALPLTSQGSLDKPLDLSELQEVFVFHM